MPAPKGNKYHLALKDPDIRQLAYKSYCDHLAKGKSKRSWVFENDEFSCTWETLEKYIKDPEEFDPIQMKNAMAKGYARWEQIVEDGAVGDNPKVNPACLQMVMRNKFGWDRVKPDTSEHKGDIAKLANNFRASSQSETETFDSPIDEAN